MLCKVNGNVLVIMVYDFVRIVFVLVENYENVRLDYFEEVVKYFLYKFGIKVNDCMVSLKEVCFFIILEVGSGIGKFIWVMVKVLLDKNVRVIVSEFLESMCE